MDTQNPEKHFDEFCDENSKVLILGSFPSQSSLKAKFFYQNHTNRFWCILGDIFGVSGLLGNIETQKAFLKTKNIALWDIWTQCYYKKPKNNADANIDYDKSVRADLSKIFKKSPQIKAVFTTIGKGKNKSDCFCKWGVKEWIAGYFPHKNVDEILFPLYSTSSRSPKTNKELLDDYKLIKTIIES